MSRRLNFKPSILILFAGRTLSVPPPNPKSESALAITGDMWASAGTAAVRSKGKVAAPVEVAVAVAVAATYRTLVTCDPQARARTALMVDHHDSDSLPFA